MSYLKNLTCPLCHKDTAKQSSAYPSSAVCFCGGEVLREVGTIENKKLIPINTSKTTPHPLSSIHFDMEYLSSKQDILDMGVIFNNALGSTSGVDRFLSQGEIWVAKYGGDPTNEFSVMFLITHREKRFTNYYLKNNGKVPYNIYKEIKEFLLKSKIALCSD